MDSDQPVDLVASARTASAELKRQRSILFSARLRLSPETQPVRESALDRLVEQLFLLADPAGGLTETGVAQQIRSNLPAGAVGFPGHELHRSISRLSLGGRTSQVAGGSSKYRLTSDAIKQLKETETEAKSRFNRVVTRLFKGKAPRYYDVFVDALAVLFARLGDEYAKAIRGDPDAAARVAGSQLLKLVTRYARRTHPLIDEKLLSKALTQFIQERDPDSDAIKWNMAQNYYVAAALGLDPSGSLLSRDVFGNAVLYLDTNLVIAAIEPTADHHRRFKLLTDACASLGIQLKVCQVSVNELRGVLAQHRILIQKVDGQIPDATAQRVRSIFLQLFRGAGSPTEPADIDALFQPFEFAALSLKATYKVELVDDPWFTEAPSNERIKGLAQRIQDGLWEQRGRVRARGSAIHDAILMEWVDRERSAGSERTWALTLDTYLPTLVPKAGDDRRPLAITLDALLQWISPLVSKPASEDDIAAIYAEALSVQLLPRERIFDLRDFVVFADLSYSCRELPAEDVEECVLQIRQMPGQLDPSNPVDREKIAREIWRFLADPSRKHKEVVSRLEDRIADLESAADRSLAEQKTRLEREAAAQLELKDAELTTAMRRAEDAEAARAASEKAGEEAVAKVEANHLRRSTKIRLGVGGAVTLGLMAGAVWLAIRYDDGGNYWQRIEHSWSYIALAFVLGCVTTAIVVGEKRLRYVHPLIAKRL